MRNETKITLKYYKRHHPKMYLVIRKALAAALEADASAYEAREAFRMAERIIGEATPSPALSEFSDEVISSLNAIEEDSFTGFNICGRVSNEPCGENR